LDLSLIHLTWTLLAETEAASCQRQTAPPQLRVQQGGDKTLLLLDGGVQRRLGVAAAVVVGGALPRPEVPGGEEVQVLGHHPQQGDGVPIPMQTQQRVRGVQEAAGGEAVQLETTLGGAAQIRRRRAVGTCDAFE